MMKPTRNILIPLVVSLCSFSAHAEEVALATFKAMKMKSAPKLELPPSKSV